MKIKGECTLYTVQVPVDEGVCGLKTDEDVVTSERVKDWDREGKREIGREREREREREKERKRHRGREGKIDKDNKR